MIIKADMKDFYKVKRITQTAIKEIYPRYYPEGAVEFFLSHHSDSSIVGDIGSGCVFLCLDEWGDAVGTVTVRGNEILRLFVLPKHQGKGLGRELLNFAEQTVAAEHEEAVIDASLPAKGIYLKRGYKETGYNIIPAGEDFLCYDVMKKKLR